MSGNEILVAVGVWTTVTLAVIAGLAKIAVAVAGLVQQVKTLFKTQESHDVRINLVSDQAHTNALAIQGAAPAAPGTISHSETDTLTPPLDPS